MFLSWTSGYAGSKAALTSQDRQTEFCRTCLTSHPSSWARSSMKSLKKNDLIPVTPSDPVSSLSAKMVMVVYSGFFTSSSAMNSA